MCLAGPQLLGLIFHDYIVSYGDAESHLNIAKRVVSSITPGFAQLGGIWLLFPHLLMIPFIWFDPLWRTGLAGSIVSSFAYIVSSVFIFKTTGLLTRNRWAGLFASLVFMLNPNILYMQTTPMTEMTLIMFFVLSIYFFIRFIRNDSFIFSLVAAAFFGFCATLTRYDGWFLVAFQGATVFGMYITRVFKEGKPLWQKLEGKVLLYATPAFFGIALWFLWDFLILGDALYFSNSEFSAKTQQANWLSRGELPSFHNIGSAVAYYLVTAMSNIGIIVFFMAVVGFISYLLHKEAKKRFLISFVLLTPFIFYIFTLFVGQSVIFIPHLTPVDFEWRLFNVRYGLMAVPFAAIFSGWLWNRSKSGGRALIVALFILQFGLYFVGYSKVITWEDGVVGLSHAKRPIAERWLKDNYDNGLVLMDDYARTVSLVRTGIPMQSSIYIGNKPYWAESLVAPERYARWIVMQKNDTVWKAVYDDTKVRGRLYKYFQKVYTSPEILIFRRISN
ncbi:glycosyltransferase family 39 protein [Candidatus Roizmanbacteria bacterium]|nr:MAG: glycosyltransferase family 39 protein [Candidatus Roizmanbacteria bacterium]